MRDMDIHFVNAPSLQYLNASNVNIDFTMDLLSFNDFSSFKLLSHLDISSNRIRVVNIRVKTLESLDLSSNHLYGKQSKGTHW